MSQDVMLITASILFLIGLVSVFVHWLRLAKRALDMGRIRLESMGEAAINTGKEDDKQE